MCQDCDQPAKMSQCRVMSRKKDTFRCRMCHSTRTTMYRRLGAGWGKRCRGIPRPVWVAFFQFAKGTSSVDAIVQSMAFMLENKHYWEGVQDVGGEYHHGGGFLPLGVWKTLGFEAAHIEKKSLPEDVMEHHELGKLYRVPLLVTPKGCSKGSSTQQAVTIGPNTFKRRRAVGPTATTTSPVAPTTENELIYGYIWSDSNPMAQHKSHSMKKALVYLTMLGEERRSAHNGTAAEA